MTNAVHNITFTEITVTETGPGFFMATDGQRTYFARSHHGAAYKAFVGIFGSDEGFDEFVSRLPKRLRRDNVMTFPKVYRNVKYGRSGS